MSEQAQHTPGPWRAELVQSLMGHGYARWQWDIMAAGGAVAEIYAKLGRTANCPEEANALLIAAAPDMYEALKGMCEMYAELVNSGDCGFWDPEEANEMKAARAAIAKAEGR